MRDKRSEAGFLQSKAAILLSAFLFAQAAAFYGFSRSEEIAVKRPLSEVPAQFGAWQMVEEGVVEKEILDVLRADEVLTRSYSKRSGSESASLFVAYFKTQRTGQSPHSPKNCLPGSGWVPSASDTLQIGIPGVPQPISVNRYVVSKGDSKSLVIYWYQSRDRVVASEYTAKFYVVADALRHNRSDTALIRVVIPVRGNNTEAAQGEAVDFIQSFFSPLRQYFPA